MWSPSTWPAGPALGDPGAGASSSTCSTARCGSSAGWLSAGLPPPGPRPAPGPALGGAAAARHRAHLRPGAPALLDPPGDPRSHMGRSHVDLGIARSVPRGGPTARRHRSPDQRGVGTGSDFVCGRGRGLGGFCSMGRSGAPSSLVRVGRRHPLGLRCHSHKRRPRTASQSSVSAACSVTGRSTHWRRADSSPRS